MFRKKGRERLIKTTVQKTFHACKSNNQFTTTEFEKEDGEDKDAAEVKDFSIDLIYSNPFLVKVS